MHEKTRTLSFNSLNCLAFPNVIKVFHDVHISQHIYNTWTIDSDWLFPLLRK
jgi:hypothetical protein